MSIESPTDTLCAFAETLVGMDDKQAESALYNKANKLPFISGQVYGMHVKKNAINKAYKIATSKELHIGL